MKQFPAAFISGLLLLVACGGEEPEPVVKIDLADPSEGIEVPVGAKATAMGKFTSYAHGLAGNAVLYTDPQGMRTLRFENFKMSAGPDVYVLVSKSNNYSEANTVAISMLKGGYDNTSLSFTIDPAIDLTTHPYVLVYCVQFSSLFGYSELAK
jgi:hypothetical protein